MPNLSSSFSIFLIILLPPLLATTTSQPTLSPPPPSPPPPPPQPPSIACKSTLYPKLCRSVLSAFKFSPSNPQNYGKFSVKQSLKQSKRLSKIINRYLHKSNKNQATTPEENNAIQDCGQLFDLTVGYLETILLELKTATSMTDGIIGKIETLLSAVVTNQNTCYDGLVSSRSSLATALSAPISSANVLYSVSLGLVTHAIGRDRRHGQKKHGGSAGKGFATDLDSESLKKALHAYSRRAKRREERNLGDNNNKEEDGGIVVNNAVVVSPYGDGNFTTIGEAIDFAPNNTKPEDGYFIIYAVEGYYQEYILVPKYKRGIMLIGDGINTTVITGNRSVVDGWTTFNSATFAVSGDRFVAIDVTFQNTAGPEKHQAVAVRNNADVTTFYRCSFEGYQDTLYAHSLRQFYRECDIYGTVDFIFGNSASVFQNCNIYARKPMPGQSNAITAQGRTDPYQKTGFSIQNCTIRAAPDLENSHINSTTLTYLGRPWKIYSRTVYMQSYIGDLITPNGWLEWNGTTGLDTIYYGEYKNHGPGSDTSMRVQWPGYGRMDTSQAWNFTVFNLTLGDTWLPYTSIPFVEGLLNDD